MIRFGPVEPPWPSVAVHAIVVRPLGSATAATVHGIWAGALNLRLAEKRRDVRDCAIHTPLSVAIAASRPRGGTAASAPSGGPASLPASVRDRPNRTPERRSALTESQHAHPPAAVPVSRSSTGPSKPRANTSCVAGIDRGATSWPRAERSATNACEIAGLSWFWTANAIAASPVGENTTCGCVMSFCCGCES